MEIYVFDRELNQIGLIDKFESLIWRRKACSTGVFELHLSYHKDLFNLLTEGNVICKSNDLNECAYIENIYIEKNKSNQSIKIDGKFISGYLGRRIIWNTQNINDTVENAIRSLVYSNCINTTPERVIPLLKLGDIKKYPEKIDFQVSYKNLEEEITKVLSEKNFNFKITTDLYNKVHKFELYKGIDRSENQSINKPCIFSSEFENIYEQNTSIEVDEYKNVALIGGEGEGKERIFSTIGESSGLDRYELFVDSDDVRSTREDDSIIPKDEYIKLINQRGMEKLNEYKKILSFEGKVNVTNSNLVYKVDFDLGDFVTLKNTEWNLVSTLKISEIEEIYEKNGLDVNIIFGDAVPNVIDKLKREVK